MMTLTAAALLPLIGCGGGGADSGTLGVYVTDNFRDDYAQVWVTLYKIEASADGARFQTLFEDPQGKALNIPSLANTAQLLARVDVPTASYRLARVTLGDRLLLVSRSGETTDAPVAPGESPCEGGRCVVRFEAPVTAAAGRPSDLVVDFDLARFALTPDGRVRPHLRQADTAQFQQAKRYAELEGRVRNLVPGSGFDLAIAGGRPIPVRLTSATAIFDAAQGTDAALANGQIVEVKGTLDPDADVLTADTARIREDGANGQGNEVRGIVVDVDSSAKHFEVSLVRVLGLHPLDPTVTILTDAETVFHRHGQDTTDFASVAVGVNVEVTGVWDATRKTLLARRVEIY